MSLLVWRHVARLASMEPSDERQQMITDTLKLHRLPHTYIHYERPGGSIDHLQLSRLPMSYKCAIQSAFCGHRSNNAFNIWD